MKRRRSSFGRRAPRQRGDRVHRRVEGVWRPVVHRQTEFQGPAGAIVGINRAERSRQVDVVPHDHRPGKARHRDISLGSTVNLAYVEQSRDDLTASRTLPTSQATGLTRISANVEIARHIVARLLDVGEFTVEPSFDVTVSGFSWPVIMRTTSTCRLRSAR